MNERILIVDDEESIVAPINYALKREGYITETAHDGEEALEKIEQFKPHLVILDVMMPKLSGYDVCKRIENGNIGVILLTAKDDITDKIVGLELGADDYMTKPFDMRELLARAKSIIRRIVQLGEVANSAEQEISDKKDKTDDKEIRINGDKIRILKNQHEVYVDGALIELKPKEFDLLVELASNINIVFSREQLLNNVWGYDYVGGTRTVDIHIQRIRKKFGAHQKHIITVHGVGYKFVGEYNEA